MNEVFDETGRMFRLASQLASGGEGVIYRVQQTESLCVKVYHEKPNAQQTAKLKLLRSRADELVKVAALPKSLAFAEEQISTPVGIIIPFVRGYEIHELYGTRARLHHFPKANFKFLVHTAYNLAHVFNDLHRNGFVVGDISEQNIKVLPDATVRLIDCDSFQVSNGETIYTSDMGTPLWTPPELQGKDLTGLQRTPNHDLFGLAQLIFLLCFAGRHPFAGVPKAGRHLSPEAAIGEHAFVFAPEQTGHLLSPPPGCPPFMAIPPGMRELFTQAFLKGSELPDARPSAIEWKDCLEDFLKNLTVCERHKGHVYWKGASSCPWCGVIDDAEVDLFPLRGEHASDTGFFVLKDAGYVMRLRDLRPYSFEIQALPVFEDLVPEPLPEPPSGIWNSLQKTVDLASWKKTWLATSLEKNREMLSSAEDLLKGSLTGQQAIIADYNREFSKIRANLLPVLRLLSKPAQVHREIEDGLDGERKHFQLVEFLEYLPLREAVVSGIGLGDKTMLQSYGIETAADITEVALSKIPGLEQSQISHLLSWRKTCETSFVFNPAKPMSELMRQEIERRVQERGESLKQEAAACETKFAETQTLFNARLRLVQSQAVQLAKQRDQAKVNIAFLEEQMRGQ
jgi:DNA-binding helix-hairpin-helix protein with protein kinase domain